MLERRLSDSLTPSEKLTSFFIPVRVSHFRHIFEVKASQLMHLVISAYLDIYLFRKYNNRYKDILIAFLQAPVLDEQIAQFY